MDGVLGWFSRRRLGAVVMAVVSVPAAAAVAYVIWAIWAAVTRHSALSDQLNGLSGVFSVVVTVAVPTVGVIVWVRRKASSLHPSTAGTEEAAPSPPVQRLPPRPKTIVGRDDILKEMEDRLTAGDHPWPRMAVLSGLAGAGKTSVALKYTYRHLDDDAKRDTDLACQFSAADHPLLEDDFRALAEELKIPGLGAEQRPVPAVHAQLASWPGCWLLIFDNASDWNSLRDFLPRAGRGRILITTQNSTDWPPEDLLKVRKLDQKAAADFLIRRCSNRAGPARADDENRRAAVELADELDGLPLALEQAGAYMQATDTRLARYLDLFRQGPEQRLRLLDRGQPIDYPKTVATTWALAFSKLEASEPDATGLLQLLAWCAPEAIPLRLLLRSSGGLIGRLGSAVAPVLVPLLDDPLTLNDAIAALGQYSLINLADDERVIADDEQVVSVHRLVQLVTRGQMSPKVSRQWRTAAGALIEAAIPADANAQENWPVYATLLPHALEALTADRPGMALLASYLGDSGSHAAARDLWEKIVQARTEDKDYGDKHRETLKARASFARWTGEAGNAVAAREQFDKLVPVLSEVFGPYNEETLRARASAAGWTGQAGKAADARELFKRLLPTIEDEFGDKHSETLTVRQEFARATGEAGDPAGARDQFRELLEDAENANVKDRAILMIRAGEAGWTGEAGKQDGDRGQLRAARELFKGLLPIIENEFGDKHPETLMARASFARWTVRRATPLAPATCSADCCLTSRVYSAPSIQRP